MIETTFVLDLADLLVGVAHLAARAVDVGVAEATAVLQLDEARVRARAEQQELADDSVRAAARVI